MRYFFIPGRLSQLSYAELVSVLEIYGITEKPVNHKDKVFYLEADVERSEMKRLFYELGGFVRFGYVPADLDEELKVFLLRDKVTFGASDLKRGYDQRDLAEKFKEYFTAHGVKSRFVVADKNILNSAQILNNKILTEGFEIILLPSDKDSEYGLSLATQEINDFAKRDYGRPYADKTMGMLPPKLARIMVNLGGAKKESTIWDPFCGSGTVLIEGLLNGYDMIGSDISNRAIQETQENIRWLTENYDIGDRKHLAFPMNVLKPDQRDLKELRNTNIQAIVCEPYMGPPQRRSMSVTKARKLLEDVSELYYELFKIVERLDKKNIRAVIVVPSYKTFDGWVTLSVNQIASKRWRILNKDYGGDLQWMRSNSIIRRNIFMLELMK